MTTDYTIDMGADPDKILLLGDTHHDARFVKKVIDHAAHNQVDTIVQVGDMGWWPSRGDCDDYFDQVDLLCRKAGINLFWVDGNHECVDELTKAVTRRGLMSIDDIRPNDEVLSVDDDGAAIWEPIEGIVRRPFDGVMHHIKSRGLDMLVTPGHRVVGRAVHSGKWVECLGGEVSEAPTFRVLRAGTNILPDSEVSDEDIRLYAWCLTDSHRRAGGDWHFYQRESQVSRITDLLGAAGIPYTTSVRYRDVSVICNKRILVTEPEVTVRVGVEEGRSRLAWGIDRLDDMVWSFSQRQVDLFLQELVFCDGSVPSKAQGAVVLYGNGKDLWWEDLRILLATSGHRTSLTEARPGDVRMNICPKKDLLFLGRSQPLRTSVTDSHYQGEVWCLKVPNGRFFIEREGKIQLTGNCHDSLVPGFKYGHRIQHLPRGFRWQWWGKTWMSVGGGASVDAHWRTPGFDWFPQETLTWDEYEYCLRPGKVDIIVSHDCPDKVTMPGLDSKARRYPEQAIRESERHRTLIGQICDTTRPDYLWHGHYHLEHQSLRTGLNGWKTAVTGLHNNEVHLSHSVQIITRADVGAQEVDHAVSG